MSVSRDSNRQRRGAIAWSVQHPLLAHLLILIVLAAGVWTALSIQKEVFPRFELDTITVSVTYPGASPSNVEQSVLLPIEEALGGVRGIKEMTSTAREGRATVTLELAGGVDRTRVLQDVNQAVDTVQTFPDAAEAPQVRLEITQREVIELGIHGDVDPWSLRQLAERLREQLLAKGSITNVVIENAPDYVTHVEIPAQRLREHDLTLSEIASRIERSSRDVPAGSIHTSHGEMLLRVTARKHDADALASIPIVASESGASVTLGELAHVSDGFEQTAGRSTFNGQPSIELSVMRSGEQSPLAIETDVQAVLQDFAATLPPGVQTRIDRNRARDFDERLNLLIENGVLALIIVLAVLSLFLEWRFAFWVMTGMAISFIAALVVVPWLGVSLNMISMFGFLVALGIVVDDAIVVGDNIYTYRQNGMDRIAAAIAGAREIAAPVTVAVATNIVAFLPLLFLPGRAGNFWWPLPVTVITVLAISLIEALLVLPAHLGRSRGGASTRAARWLHDAQQRFSRGFDHVVERYYGPLLRSALGYRYVTLFGAATLLAVTVGYATSGHMGLTYMPEGAAQQVKATVGLPRATTPDQAERIARAVTEATNRLYRENDLAEVAQGVKSDIRSGESIELVMVLERPGRRDMSAKQIMELWHDQLGPIRGVDQVTFEAGEGLSSDLEAIGVSLGHSDYKSLIDAARRLQSTMAEFDATRYVSHDYQPGQFQLDFTLLPQAHAMGLTPADVGRQLRNAFHGAVAERQLRGTDEIEVRVKLPESERESLHHLERFVVQTPQGADVPLWSIASVRPGNAFDHIPRRQGKRAITVTMAVVPKSAAGRIQRHMEGEVLPQLRSDFPGLTWSFEGRRADLRDFNQSLLVGFLLAVGAIYTLLATVFGNYRQPLIVLAAIPFGVIGGVVGHILLDYDLSLVSLMGVVALSGIVVNDALIMIDYANRRERGDAFAVIQQAARRRFRPILLTTLTTFGGLTPIILETSPQAAYVIPMAIGLGFGIVFATAIILILVPCLYCVSEELAGPRRGNARTRAN